MKVLDRQEVALDPGILREAGSDGGRIVLWLPGDRDGAFQHWERIGSVARAEVIEEEGLCAIAATSVTARQRIKGVLGKLLGRLHEAKGGRSLVLPSGESAEQTGDRATDLILVWGADEAEPIDEARVQARWPEAGRYRRLGPKLYLVGGLGMKIATSAAPEPMPLSDGNPRTLAEQMLNGARQGGDRVKEVSALTDLGIITLSEGNAQGAITLFEQAIPLARQLGDAAKECDIMGNLGMALLYVQQPGRARQFFEHTLAHARSTGDRMAEKVALERLGLAASNVGDSHKALDYYEQATELARQVGDRHQEANLLWLRGIQLAELGQRDAAIDTAQNAITLFQTLGKPQASWYGAYLQKYRMGLYDTWPSQESTGVAVGPQAFLGGSLTAGVMGGPPAGGSTTPRSTNGPGLLRMALSATKSMAQFAGSGFKTTSPDLQRQRLQTCAGCEHHTGLRCKICGCFTAAKSKLLHESCPLGKWPG